MNFWIDFGGFALRSFWIAAMIALVVVIPIIVGARTQKRREEDVKVSSLDERFEKGGLAAVRDFVEKEFVPGRSIVMPSNVPGEPLPSFSLIDREIRRCNTDGAVVLDAPPVLARGMATMKLGNDSLIETWSRTSINDPYQLTVWWVRHRGP